MRIAVFHELPPGGARLAVNEIGKRLAKNHSVDLYYTDVKSDLAENKNFSKAYFFKFVPKKWSGKNFKVRIYKDTLELYKLSRLHKKIAKIIDSKEYDIVLVNASKYIEAPFILRSLKSKTAFYLHDPHFRVVYESIITDLNNTDPIRVNYQKLHNKLLKKLDKQNIESADFLLANSKYTKKQTFKSYHLQSEVVYLGVDTHFFKPANILKKNIDVLYIGSKDVLDGYQILNNSRKFLNKNIFIEEIFKEDTWLVQEKVRELYRRSKIVVCLGRNEPVSLQTEKVQALS